MASKEIKYQPLDGSLNDSTEDVLLLREHHVAANIKKERLWKVVASLSMLFLVLSNGIWIGLYRNHKTVLASPLDGPDPNFPLQVPYYFSTEFSLGNVSEQNLHWESLFPPGYGAVKVESDWAIEHGLTRTQGYAPDGKAIYVIAMYHQLHCLAVIRTSLYQYHYGLEQLDPWTHIPHCLDALRQALQCLADPTLGGVGHNHECRDFDALKGWAADNAYTEYFLDVTDI